MKRVVFRVRVSASGLLQRQHIVFLLRQPCSRMLHLAPFPTSQEQDDALLAHFVQRGVPFFSLWHKEAEKNGNGEAGALTDCFPCSGEKIPERPRWKWSRRPHVVLVFETLLVYALSV